MKVKTQKKAFKPERDLSGVSKSVKKGSTPLNKKKLALIDQEPNVKEHPSAAVAAKKGKTNARKKIAVPDPSDDSDEDVPTSECDTDDEQHGDTNGEEQPESGKDPVANEEKPKKVLGGKEYTAFIGNLPPSMTDKTVKSMFKKYGTILTVRARTNDGRKIFKKKNRNLLKSLNYYVRFSTKQEMENACEMNGQKVGDSVIRVCPQQQKMIGAVNSTVFVGNIHKDTTDDQLYEFFSRVGEIEYVRQISTKHVAYVCFKKGVSIKKALKLDQEKLHNRPLRIMKVDKTRNDNAKLNKKGHIVQRHKTVKPATASNGEKTEDTGAFAGKMVAEKQNKKKPLKSGKGSLKDKKMLAQKLKAAMQGTKK